MTRGELRALLTLLATPGLSQARVLALLRAYGSGVDALGSLERECGGDVARQAGGTRVERRVHHALHTIDVYGIRTVACGDATYPGMLPGRLGDMAPPVLFARGDLSLLSLTSVAVVGSRRASEYGRDVAEQIGAGVTRAGGCLVSGLARGIDAAAHAAALDAGGATIAVLGCGVDVYYPQQNMRLQDRIAESGLLLSEFLPGDSPRKYAFPHRNRLIAALSAAVVVVEAGERSGAIGTAEHAMAMDTPTFGVPNALDRPNMQGILGLYRDGMPPFTGVTDLLEFVGLLDIGEALAERPEPLPPAAPLQARIWAALDREPRHVDGIAAAAGITPAQALGALLELELDGRVRQVPGGRFLRPARSRSG